MPPAVVKSVKDLIYWQYAKIIAESAGIGKKDYGFVMNKFKQLKQGEIMERDQGICERKRIPN
jgi:hypothetical protein